MTSAILFLLVLINHNAVLLFFFWNESCQEAPYAVSLGLALWFQRRSLLKKNWRSCDGRGLVLVLNIEFISLTSLGSFLKDIITVVTLLYYR